MGLFSVTYASFLIWIVSHFDGQGMTRYNAEMKILALETSGERASVALWRDGDVVERAITAVNQHSRVVPAMIDEILREAELSLSGLDAIAFGSGPGAFTGLRIACGVAQGLALGADLKVVAVPTLQAIAAAAQRERVLAATDARMGEIYIAAYVREPSGWRCELEPTLCRPETAPAVHGSWSAVGNGFEIYAAELARRYGAQIETTLTGVQADARYVAELAALPHAQWLDPAQAAPLYVRNKVALTLAER